MDYRTGRRMRHTQYDVVALCVEKVDRPIATRCIALTHPIVFSLLTSLDRWLALCSLPPSPSVSLNHSLSLTPPQKWKQLLVWFQLFALLEESGIVAWPAGELLGMKRWAVRREGWIGRERECFTLQCVTP